MADEDESGRRGGEENLGPAMGPIFMMCENSLDKLKILNYETGYLRKGSGRKPISRVHFAIPASNASIQFNEFVGICQWLITEITAKTDAFKVEEYDDPNTIANKLMLALRQLELRSSFPPQKLKTPYGETVCEVLDFLTDKALQSRGFQWQTPIYSSMDEAEMAPPDDEEDEEDEVEDEAVAADEDIFFEEASRLETSLDSSQHNIILAQIDPIEWKTELERVGPKLRANQALSTNEWRSHVDQTVSTKATIAKLMSESGSDLQLMNKSIAEELSQLRQKEKYINNQHNTLSLEFAEVKQRLEELEKNGTVARDVTNRLTNELAEVSEKLDDIKETLESRDSGLHDTSPLVKIKAALQQIKEEIYAFDLRIGVVSHSLLTARVGDNNRLRAKAASKAKQRHRKKKGDRNHGDDNSLNSGDD